MGGDAVRDTGSLPLLSRARENGVEKAARFRDSFQIGDEPYDPEDRDDHYRGPPLKPWRRGLRSIPVLWYWGLFILTFLVGVYSAFALGQRYEGNRLRASRHVLGLSGELLGNRDQIVFSNGTEWARHPGLKIVAVVFYGRRQFVDILDCYLRRSLAFNGGLLDEVQFIMHTDVEQDVKYLRDMVKSSGLGDHYKLIEKDTKSIGWSQWEAYANLYRDHMTDPNTIYVKIDDDVMFIDDFAISELIRTVLEHPEAHSVLANIVNNRRNHWYHHRMDAAWPYLPDLDRSREWALDTWRPSELPPFPEDQIGSKGRIFFPGYPTPFPGHRWLPMSPSVDNMQRTPYSNHLPDPTYELTGPMIGWAVAAQAHYSLFENLERGLLRKYYFGNGIDYSFNLRFTRTNTNFFAIRGSNVAKRPLWDDPEGAHMDEELLTEIIPRELDMPALVATRAIVSHYSMHNDRVELLKTDLLDRYRAYANEMVCEPDNLKKSFADKKSDTQHLLEAGEEPDPGDGPGDSQQSPQQQNDVADAPPIP